MVKPVEPLQAQQDAGQPSEANHSPRAIGKKIVEVPVSAGQVLPLSTLQNVSDFPVSTAEAPNKTGKKIVEVPVPSLALNKLQQTAAVTNALPYGMGYAMGQPAEVLMSGQPSVAPNLTSSPRSRTPALCTVGPSMASQPFAFTQPLSPRMGQPPSPRMGQPSLMAYAQHAPHAGMIQQGMPPFVQMGHPGSVPPYGGPQYGMGQMPLMQQPVATYSPPPAAFPGLPTTPRA